MASEEPIGPAVYRILRYFVDRPQAADDLEGIVRWRLMELAIEQTVRETKSALEWLVKAGFLEETRTTGTKPIYSLRHDKAAEAESFLETREDR